MGKYDILILGALAVGGYYFVYKPTAQGVKTFETNIQNSLTSALGTFSQTVTAITAPVAAVTNVFKPPTYTGGNEWAGMGVATLTTTKDPGQDLIAGFHLW